LRAVIYCRVSTEEQVDNTSLASQEKICKEWCERQGIEVDRAFIEQGESAKTTRRTQFQDMYSYCRQSKGRLQFVVVYKVNRFSRDNYDHHVYKALFAKVGVTLRSATKYFDDSPVGKLTENMLSAFSQFDNDQRSENTVVGMKAALREGRWTFKAPLGYMNMTDQNGKPTIAPEPFRAPLIQNALESYSTGKYTKTQVLAKVTALGLRTVRNKPVAMQTFGAILRNPIYAGLLHVKKWDVWEKGSFQPLIGKELYDRIQALSNGSKLAVTPHVRNHPDFPLRVFVTCGSCSRPITGSWSKGRKQKYPYYRCPNKKCRAVNVRKEKLESDFLSLLQRLHPKPEYLSLFKKVVVDTWKQKQGDAELTIRKLQERLEGFKDKKKRLLDALLDVRVKQADYEEANDGLSEEIAGVELAIHEAKLDELDIEALLGFSEHVLGDSARLWFEANVDQKQRLQKVLFPKGLCYSAAEGFGTAATCSMFSMLEDFVAQKTGLASPTGFEPVLPP
jgi:DNA invertase Pin-like site-specific DNA recombinase